MALFLTEREVERLLDMGTALEAVEEAFRHYGSGAASNRPRTRLLVPGGVLHVMSAAIPAMGAMGLKSYSTFRSGNRFLFLLYSTETGELLSIMEADRLGQVRTGAASGVATKYLAREDADTIGIFGTGWQAEAQLEAICAVRRIKTIKAYSRNPANRERFCHKMSALLGIEVRAVESPEEAARGAGVIVTATTAKEPVLKGEWLEPGTHINAVGVNWANRRELDEAAVRRADLIVVDSKEQSEIESGDLLPLLKSGTLSWDRIRELGEIVAGRFAWKRSSAEQITLFKSHGIAIEDVAAAIRVYHLARERGLGTEVPIGADSG